MKKNKLIVNIIVIIIAVLCAIILGFTCFYNLNLKSVSKDSKEVEFMVESGSTYYNIISKLKDNGLIRNELCFKLYIKFNKVNDLEAGKYLLNTNMNVSEIVEIFSNGNVYNPDAVVITFKEGKHMRDIANTISKYTNNTGEDVYNVLKDKLCEKSTIVKHMFSPEMNIKKLNKIIKSL